MGFLNSWASSVVVAIVIATLLEIMLPNGNSKKYVKMIIGLFILFIILNPIISKFTKVDFNNVINSIHFEEVKTENLSTSSIVDDTYKDKFKEIVNEKLKKKGYKLKSFDVETKYEKNELKLKKLKIGVVKDSNKKTSNLVNPVVIDASSKIENNKDLSEDEKNKIKEDLANELEIESDLIEFL